VVVFSLVCALAGFHCSAHRDLPPGPDLEAVAGDATGKRAGTDLAMSHACRENLIPNSDLIRDENEDGNPDPWVPGSSPSLIRDSSVGCQSVGKDKGKAKALWITGGRDMAGEWGVPLSGVQPGQTYLLSFFLYRKDFHNGWYPEVEIFGQRHYLNHHTSYRTWQRVELLVTAPEDQTGTVWFRFFNRYPTRFWLSRPCLRPYRLCRMWAGYTRNGVELRWEESLSDLVLEMELSVEDGRGKVSRSKFLNVEAMEAWERLRGDAKNGAGKSRNPACFQNGLAWAPLKGRPPFRVRLKSLFQGRKIGETGYALKRAGSRKDKNDLAGMPPPRLQPAPSLPEGFFPIGIFDVPPEEVKKTAEAGFNTAHLILPEAGDTPSGKTDGSPGKPAAGTLPKGVAEATEAVSLRWMLSALNGRRLFTPGELRELAAQAGDLKIRGERFLCLYAADEPELSGISPLGLYSFQGTLRRMFPGTPTAAALVRAQLLPYYQHCADWFLIDPYPVPHQPLTWMSDSLEAARDVRDAHRVMAVVQAFGGKDTAEQGWDRFPTLEEMRTLAFLGLVHGARGLFFYHYPSASASEEQWGIVKRVVRDLNKVYPWIVRPASDRCPSPWILSPEGWSREPGRVHCAFFPGSGGDSGVLVVVNPSTLPVEVRFEGLWGEKDELIQELLNGRPLVLKKGCLIDSLPPRAVSVYSDVTL